MNAIATVARLDDERLIRDGEAAVDGYNKDLHTARARIMPMARGLCAARRKYPANQDFGDWLQGSSYREIEKDDRAALIKIGEYDDFAAKFVRTTFLVSPRTIWDAIQELLPSSHDAKTTDQPSELSETDAQPSTAPIQSVSTVPENDQKSNLPAARYPIKATNGADIRHPSKADLVAQLGIPVDQFIAVMGAYPPERQRVITQEFVKFAGKKGSIKAARGLFERAFNIVKAGHAPELSNKRSLDMRIFLPDVSVAFCENNIDLKKLMQRLDRLDLLNARAAELTAAGTELAKAYQELHHIWETGIVRPPSVTKPIELAPDDSKNRVKHEVKYCGEIIWPNQSLKHVTYQDLNMGWHIADHWLKRLEVATPLKPNELLVEIMHLVQDLRAASSLAGVTDVMTMCVQAYAKRNQRRDKADLSDGMPPGRPR